MGYWQSSLDTLEEGDWLPPFSPPTDNNTRDWVAACGRAPLFQPCLNEIGVPILAEVALGGFQGKEFSQPTAFVLTLLVTNHVDSSDNGPAMAWEQELLNFLESDAAANLNFTLAFSTERSIQDELARETSADIPTIIISYGAMFIYIAVSLGSFECPYLLYRFVSKGFKNFEYF